MISRFTLFFSLILLIFFTFYALLSRPFVCTDPGGCIWIGPQDPLVLGLNVITTGVDRPITLEIQRSLDLFSQNFVGDSTDHLFRFKSYYSACLPNVPVQSTVDLSGDNKILAVVGPVCTEDTTDFIQRMVSANKALISPIPYRSIPNDVGISVNPDIHRLAIQAAGWIQKSGFFHILVTHDMDDQSILFSTKLCEIFSANGTCLEINSEANDLQLDQFDASVQVFLNESNLPILKSILTRPGLPQILISFSKPLFDIGLTPSFYWIGPQLWNENKDFSEAYFALYDSYPSTMASWVMIDRLAMIYNTVKETAVIAWDGSWIIPMNRFKQQLISNFSRDDIFCSSGSSDCPELPIVLYEVSGNEYKIFNP